jgi:hypothetical protein
LSARNLLRSLLALVLLKNLERSQPASQLARFGASVASRSARNLLRSLLALVLL